MKFLVFSVAVALVAGQQFQQSLEFNNPAVRLAGPGFFQQGSSFSSGFSSDNSRNNQFQNRGSTAQFSPLSNNRDSESFVRFQNENQFQSGGISFQQNQQNTFNSFDNENRDRFQAQSLQQNQQEIFSTGAFQQDSGNQFQTSSSLSSSQINDGFSLGFTQGLSSSQPQTFTDSQQDSRSNRLTAINIQLTPSVSFQDQQITGTSFQSNSNQQNNDNRFQQTSFTGTRFVNNNNNNNNNNNIQFNTNSQVSSTSQSQSSNRQQLNAASSLSQFTDEVNGVFEPLNLPSGATLLLGRISSSFSCADRPYGYYADQENSCRVFHVCNPALFSDGKIETYQYSFMCGEGTVFDQDALTCKVEYDATPCQEAANFYFRNEQFGRLEDRNF